MLSKMISRLGSNSLGRLLSALAGGALGELVFDLSKAYGSRAAGNSLYVEPRAFRANEWRYTKSERMGVMAL